MKITKNTRELLNKRKIARVDIGCGGAKQGEDWFGIDRRPLPGVDLIQNLEKFPWGVPNESFDIAIASHVLEHIQKANGIMLSFFNETWRILRPCGQFIIGAPYATSSGFYRDPTHTSPINEELFSYFDPHDQFFNGGLYNIYSPLPWEIKINTWHATGNIEVVLVKRDIKPEYNVDKEYLRLLKKHTKLTK
jgi:SAM-dependent methyltransferase